MYDSAIVSAPVTRPSAGWTLTGRRSMLGITARALGQLRRRAVHAGILTATVLRVALRFVLIVAGLGWLDAAAWMWHAPAGMAAIGVSCLVLEWAVKRE